MANTVYLLTGANKGIGRAIAAQLLLRPSTTLIAAVRSPTDPTSASLPSLPTAASSALHLVALATPADFTALPAALTARGIAHLDVVIANAGAASGFKGVLDTTPEDVGADLVTNAVLPVRLFQAVWGLLKAGGQRKIVFVSSSLGSIGGLEEESFPGVGYGMGKAAMNYFAKKVSVELKGEGAVVGLVHPGWVQTTLGHGLAESLGVKEVPMTPEQSAEATLREVDGFTKETSGSFVHANTGKDLPY